MEIRFTIKKDLSQLPWLYRQYYNGDNGLETDVDGMYRKYEELIKNEDYKFVSAVEGEKLLGFCSLVVNHDIVEKQKPILMIWNLRVHPEYRNRGIGSKIMTFVEDFAKKINADLIMLTCDYENNSQENFIRNKIMVKIMLISNI